MSLDSQVLFSLARTYSNAAYGNTQDFLSIGRVQQTVIAAALRGQYSVVFEYPQTVSQALLIEQEGKTPDFSAEVLTYYKTATNKVVTHFTGSAFVLTGLPNAGGFKISWSTEPAPAVTSTPVVESVEAKDNVVTN